MQIYATLCFNQFSLPLQALTDSGAGDNFLDNDLALQSGIPLEELESPLTANALDGRVLALVTRRTVPVSLVLSGNHIDLIQFNIISAPTTPPPLGHPWLKLHNQLCF